MCATCSLQPNEQVRVYSHDADHRERFAQQMQDELGRPVLALASCAEGLFEAGIIYVPTSSADPVFFATELGEGTFLASMGTPRELDASVYLAADDIVVSYKPTFLFSKEDIGQLIDLDRMGEVNWENDVDELSAILSGKDSVNPATDRRTIFRAIQGRL